MWCESLPGRGVFSSGCPSLSVTRADVADLTPAARTPPRSSLSTEFLPAVPPEDHGGWLLRKPLPFPCRRQQNTARSDQAPRRLPCGPAGRKDGLSSVVAQTFSTWPHSEA